MKKGYNTAFTFSTIFNKKSNEIKFADFLNKQGEKIDLLRFSGGILSFTYDISSPEYGSEKNQYLEICNPKNYIYNYINFVKSLNYRPKTIYCVNMHPLFCDITKIDAVLLPLKELVRNLGDIYAVELGNESSFHFSDKMDIYSEICKKLIEKIKKIAPNALISVPTEGCTSKRGNTWNKMVSKLTIDAIVPHWYIDSIKKIDYEFIRKISIIEDKKMVRMPFKVLCTEYNFEYKKYFQKRVSEIEKKNIVNAMENKGIDLGFDCMLFHSLLCDESVQYSRYIINSDYAIR